MSAKQSSPAGGGCGLLGVFLVLGAIGLLVKYWWVVLIALGVVALTVGIVRLARTPIPPKSTSPMPRPSRPKAVGSPRSSRGDGPGVSWRREKGPQFDAEAFYRERRAKKREEQAAALRGWDRLFADMQRQMPNPSPPRSAQPAEERKEPAPAEKPKEKPAPEDKPARENPLADPLFGVGYADKFGQTLATGDRIARIEGYAEEIEGAPVWATTGTVVGSGLARFGPGFAQSPAIHVQWDLRARHGGYDEKMPFHALPVVFSALPTAPNGVMVCYYIRKIEDASGSKKSK